MRRVQVQPGSQWRGLALVLPVVVAELVYLLSCHLVSPGDASPLDPLLVLFLPLSLGAFLAVFTREQPLLFFFVTATSLAGIGFIPGSAGLNSVYVLLLVGGFLAANVLFRATPSQGVVFEPLPRPFGALLGAVLISLLLSTALSSVRGYMNAGMLMGVSTFLLAGVLAIFVAAMVRTEETVGRLLLVVAVAVTLASILWLPAVAGAVGKRMYMPFQSVPVGLNEVGGGIGMLNALTLGLLVFEQKHFRRALLVVALVVLTAGLVLTKSRGAWVGSLAGVAYILIRTRRVRALLATLASTLAVATLLDPVKTAFVARLSQTEAGDPSWIARLFMWRTALSIIPRNLLFGIGLHNFGLVKYDYGFPRSLDPLVPSFRYQPSLALYGHTHNIYIELLMDLGILGFGALILLFLLLGTRLDAAARQSEHQVVRGPAIGLAALLVTFMVHSIFDYTLWINYSLFFVAVFVGLSLAVVRLSLVGWSRR